MVRPHWGFRREINYRLTRVGMGHRSAQRGRAGAGGCGRKGPLDLPPTAAGPRRPWQRDADDERREPSPGVFNPTYGADEPPAAPKGSRKSFILDPLLE